MEDEEEENCNAFTDFNDKVDELSPDFEKTLDQYIFATVGVSVDAPPLTLMDKGECKVMLRKMYDDYVSPLQRQLQEAEEENVRLRDESGFDFYQERIKELEEEKLWFDEKIKSLEAQLDQEKKEKSHVYNVNKGGGGNLKIYKDGQLLESKGIKSSLDFGASLDMFTEQEIINACEHLLLGIYADEILDQLKYNKLNEK